jgi:hypothetical protein
MGLADAVFVVLVPLYVIVAMKINEWSALVSLGFESETPQGFTDLPWIYALARSSLFFLTMLMLLVTVFIPWQVGLAALAVAWIVSDWRGRRKAFDTIRQICRESLPRIEDAEARAQCEEWSKKQDWEFEELIRSAKRRSS